MYIKAFNSESLLSTHVVTKYSWWPHADSEDSDQIQLILPYYYYSLSFMNIHAKLHPLWIII